MMNFIQELVNNALEDKYLQKLIAKMEHIYGLYFLKKSIDNLLTEKEYLDIMRFADILSRDVNCEGRNLSYKIIVSALSKGGFSIHTNPVIMIARC